MKIVIADGRRVFAEVLTLLLEKAGHDIVGWATDLDGVLAVTDPEQVDACVIDLDLPGCERADALAGAVARSPRTAFMVLAESVDPERFSAAITAGVSGIALKSDDLVEILRVLQGAVASRTGHRARGNATLSMSARSGRAPRAWRAARIEPGQFLTQREREVLARLVRGESTVIISRAMGVKVSTARSHIDAVLTKLGVHTRIEAVAYAVRAGLVDVARPAVAADIGDLARVLTRLWLPRF